MERDYRLIKVMCAERRMALVGITVAFLVVVVLVAIVEKNQFL